MAAITDQTIVTRNADLPQGKVDGEMVALDLARGECFGMDRVGTEIWSLLDAPISVGALVAAACERFAVGEAECRADLAAFLEELADAGLVSLGNAR